MERELTSPSSLLQHKSPFQEVEYRYYITRVSVLGLVPVLHRAGTGTLRVVRLTEARVCTFSCGVPVLQPAFRLDWKDSNSHLEIERASFAIGTRKLVDTFVRRNEEVDFGGFGFVKMGQMAPIPFTLIIACLPLCSIAHACEGRSLQAGTPEIAIATYARPCGIGRRHGLPWGRLIPRVGMLTTTGPLGTAQARQPSEPSAPAEARDHGKGIA
uniref:Uncharacterized protein n=1 Tax=Ananas comosus var. bracteatus TaxID=296719 RepID=A0A6V7P1R3_ANACO|nr:unnamed protein product [Ananas comosus var. bracteatus]